MTIDQASFLERVQEKPFNGTLTKLQAEGMRQILNEWERRAGADPRWLAYMLATTFHETARRMEPVIETRQAGEAANPSVDTAIARREHAWAAGRLPWVKKPYWRKDDSGRSYLGRGFVQITGRGNYERATKELGIPLLSDPDLALRASVAAPVLFQGLTEGWFRGDRQGRHTLQRYFNSTTDDPVGAREIVNGRELAKLGGRRVLLATVIAGYHHAFLRALSPGRDIVRHGWTAPAAFTIDLGPDDGRQAWSSLGSEGSEPHPDAISALPAEEVSGTDGVLQHTVSIVTAYLGKNAVAHGDLPAIIRAVHLTLEELHSPAIPLPGGEDAAETTKDGVVEPSGVAA